MDGRCRTCDGRIRWIRRVGITLIVVSALFVVTWAALMFNPPGTDENVLATTAGAWGSRDREGGTLLLETDAPGALELRYWNGTIAQRMELNGSTVVNLDRPFMNLTVISSGITWQRWLHVPSGSQLHLQLRAGDPAGPTWSAVGMDTQLRIFGGAMVAFSGVVLAGGVAAVRLRGFQLALVSIGLTMVVWFFIAAATRSPLGFLVFGFTVLGTMAIFRGRKLFAQHASTVPPDSD